MMWNGVPGLCLKMSTASGNTSKMLQRTPSLTIKKLAQSYFLKSIAVPSIFCKKIDLTWKKNFCYTFKIKEGLLIN